MSEVIQFGPTSKLANLQKAIARLHAKTCEPMLTHTQLDLAPLAPREQSIDSTIIAL